MGWIPRARFIFLGLLGQAYWFKFAGSGLLCQISGFLRDMGKLIKCI